jgi:hypothetical protein
MTIAKYLIWYVGEENPRALLQLGETNKLDYVEFHSRIFRRPGWILNLHNDSNYWNVIGFKEKELSFNVESIDHIFSYISFLNKHVVARKGSVSVTTKLVKSLIPI